MIKRDKAIHVTVLWAFTVDDGSIHATEQQTFWQQFIKAKVTSNKYLYNLSV